MAKSMTGFGRSEREIDGMLITVELKSVNHRYFEFFSRVPRAYSFIEEKIKSFVQSKVARGKIECSVTIEELDSDNVEVVVNHSLAGAYYDALKEMLGRYEVRDDISVGMLSRYPDILTVRKKAQDEEKLWENVKSVLSDALDAFINMRCVEGERLAQDVKTRCEYILECVSFVEERSPQTVKEYNEKLLSRLQELLDSVNIDEQRILIEAAIYADKIAVAEETVRLRSHISQLYSFLESNEAIGRKMDFLVQEMNREANTIGSKANDIEIARKVVDIKAEIEKIREQIQNIE